MYTLETASQLLGGAETLGVVICNDIDFVSTSREGLPVKAATLLADALIESADPNSDFHIVLGPLGELAVNHATIADSLDPTAGSFSLLGQRDPVAGLKLTPEQSDLVIRIATIFGRAIEVFGDRKKAVRWLGKENRALGDARPITLLDTYVGTKEVERVLGRIEHGVYS